MHILNDLFQTCCKVWPNKNVYLYNYAIVRRPNSNLKLFLKNNQKSNTQWIHECIKDK